jgi:membrane associated rhomboid family serine protease
MVLSTDQNYRAQDAYFLVEAIVDAVGSVSTLMVAVFVFNFRSDELFGSVPSGVWLALLPGSTCPESDNYSIP